MENNDKKTHIADFAAGCFWGVEEAFKEVPGVKKTTAGYAGGKVKNPSYEDVCSGKTGHAETVRVEYDPMKVSYKELLNIFWKIHDPTTLNRQGMDVGEQYRSAVFFHNPAQEFQARESKEAEEKSGKHSGKIVTEIVPAGDFYLAEEYHQDYLAKKENKAGDPVAIGVIILGGKKEDQDNKILEKEESPTPLPRGLGTPPRAGGEGKKTEPPFTGKLLHENRKGIYRCAVCGNEIFSSEAKFDSGSGWPSFDRAIKDGAVKLAPDTSLGMERTEVICGKCGSHLGHVFDDGPTPSGKRFCVNSKDLDFESNAD